MKIKELVPLVCAIQLANQSGGPGFVEGVVETCKLLWDHYHPGEWENNSELGLYAVELAERWMIEDWDCNHCRDGKLYLGEICPNCGRGC